MCSATKPMLTVSTIKVTYKNHDVIKLSLFLGSRIHSCTGLQKYGMSQCKLCGRIEVGDSNEAVATTNEDYYCTSSNANATKDFFCGKCFFGFKVKRYRDMISKTGHYYRKSLLLFLE